MRALTRAGRQEVIAERKASDEAEEELFCDETNPMPDVFSHVEIVEVSDLQTEGSSMDAYV